MRKLSPPVNLCVPPPLSAPCRSGPLNVSAHHSPSALSMLSDPSIVLLVLFLFILFLLRLLSIVVFFFLLFVVCLLLFIVVFVVKRRRDRKGHSGSDRTRTKCPHRWTHRTTAPQPNRETSL